MRWRIIEPVGASEPGASEPRREKERSLWLNRAVADELRRDPVRGVAIARANIPRWLTVHEDRPSIVAALQRWAELLDEGVDATVAVLTGAGEEAEDLRQNSPFPGVLADEERARVLMAFRRSWETMRQG